MKNKKGKVKRTPKHIKQFMKHTDDYYNGLNDFLKNYQFKNPQHKTTE